MSSEPGAERILNQIAYERARQVSKHGWDAAHDDTHTCGELARQAATFALIAAQHAIAAAPNISPAIVERDGCTVGLAAGAVSPWPNAMHKAAHENPRHLLIQAAALLVAEIQRLDRGAPPIPALRPEQPAT